ncbi:MAG TPA: winged helix-turn-helix transcriptional regulator [Candidatus Diapherotrites archaeon]|nr:winged helix-turn-helix transcriptional regulator [Candidatus Diapherotrites archaeon]
MFLKKIIPIFIFLIILNYNFAQTVDFQKTEITHYEFDTYKIKDSLIVSNITKNQLVFDIVPCYDVIVKINNHKTDSISYNLNTLTINLNDNLKDLKKINIEIIYLTDYYTNKEKGTWILNYGSRYKNKIDELKITLPKNAKILDTPSGATAQVINKQINLSLKEIAETHINYEMPESSSGPNYYVMILVLIIGIVSFYFAYKKKPKVKNKTKSKTSDLLLGLNENEQKIIKVVMEKEGQTQKAITAKSFLPKGTVSRNIKKLSDKGYIEIKKYGVSNKIFLGEVFNKK